MAIATRNPRFWLAMLMLALLGGAWATGFLTVAETKDSHSYIEASRLPLGEMLGGICTIGYPLLLKAVTLLPRGLAWVPWVHLAMHYLAVGFFYSALCRFGASPWHALAASAGFLVTMLGDRSIGLVLTDFLGRDMAVVSISFLFWLAASPKEWSAWLGLVLAVAFCYHLRPAYLFLVALAPCLGLLLLRIRTSRDGEPFAWKRFALALGAASLLPYLSFCLVRLLVVGHFGLVSFGGINMVGITAELLDGKLVDNQLPETWRPLAREILRQRETLGTKSPFLEAGIDMTQWAMNYNDNVWRAAIPAAQRVYGDDPVVVNRRLTAFSRAVLQARKSVYLRFLAYNFRGGLGRILDSGWIVQGFAALGLLAFALRVWICSRPAPNAKTPNMSGGQSILDAVLLVSILFTLAKLMLVALVEMMLPRYVLAAGVLLPSALALVAWQQLETICKYRRLAEE